MRHRAESADDGWSEYGNLARRRRNNANENSGRDENEECGSRETELLESDFSFFGWHYTKFDGRGKEKGACWALSGSDHLIQNKRVAIYPEKRSHNGRHSA
jgi:hypothetical protein